MVSARGKLLLPENPENMEQANNRNTIKHRNGRLSSRSTTDLCQNLSSGTSLYLIDWAGSSDIARQRMYILYFWRRHGLQATEKTFGLSRRTLYRWKRKFSRAQYKPQALTPSSTAPRHARARFPWPDAVINEIFYLRKMNPKMGKTRIHATLRGYCAKYYLPCPSESTIGRLLMEQEEQEKQETGSAAAPRDDAGSDGEVP